MSGNQWTAEQLAAITESGCNLLVAAAAGAGKTAVLVERIIRKITDPESPVDIDRLLVVTFTNAAAAEMRERIGEAISAALEKNPQSRQLQRQLSLLGRASITTIHSFCLEVIRNHFHVINMDPGFRICDETEASLLKNEALEELFESMYQPDKLGEEFKALVECYGGGRDDSLLQEMVLSLHSYIQSHPWPDAWLQENAEAFLLDEDADLAATRWGRVVIQSLDIELRGLRNLLMEAEDIIRNCESIEPYGNNIHEDMALIQAMLDHLRGDWNTLHGLFDRLSFSTLTRCKKDADKEKQEQVKALRKEVKDRITKIRDDLFSLSPQRVCDDLRTLYPVIRCLCDLVRTFEELYQQKKQAKSLVDFNDLEHLCLKLLTQQGEGGKLQPTDIALQYRERFEEVLVDEYQDSNLVQEVILGAISRTDAHSPNLFMVGDVKQSIYRFRQARPELFMEKYTTYSNHAGSKHRRIQLYKNFRSRQAVIGAVNYIFRQIMSVHVGELEYTEEEALYPGAAYDHPEEGSVYAGPVEVHILDRQNEASTVEEAGEEEESGSGEENEEEALDAVQLEARFIARRIHRLLEDGYQVYDRSIRGYRRVEFKDIVILLRSTRNWAQEFLEELAVQGIPAYADCGTGYFRTTEVQTVLSLLQVIDNPLQDIPLLSVLRSPICNFAAAELIDIRLQDKKAPFYSALQKYARTEQGAGCEKAAWLLNRLEEWRKLATYMSTDELIWYLYSDTGYFEYVGAMPGGVQRQANLRILFERARQYEKTSYSGLFHFIHFINRIQSGSGDMGSAKTLGENDNVVRIMSIHKSKGLEFPVVFVSGCGKKFNMQDTARSILLHQDLGFGPDFVDSLRRFSYPTLPKQALKLKIKLETLSEEMRILYVAFTRAREKLIITGSVKDGQKALERWKSALYSAGDKLPEYYTLKSSTYLDWVMASVLRHRQQDTLRSRAGCQVYTGSYDAQRGREMCLIEDDSQWEVALWSRAEVMEDSSMPPAAAQVETADTDTGEAAAGIWAEEVRKRLEWHYAYTPSAALPVKISVTEIKRQLQALSMEEEGSLPIPMLISQPAFLEEKRGLTAAEKGTAVHFVLQHLDLTRVRTAADISEQIDFMEQQNLLTPAQAAVVDPNRIWRFFTGALGRRMLSARSVRREIPFHMEIRAGEIYPALGGESEQETLLMQGMIDCCFEEEDGWVLLDYKTDSLYAANIETTKEKYKIQVTYYARAWETLMKKKVKEKYIYLFWNNTLIPYEEG